MPKGSGGSAGIRKALREELLTQRSYNFPTDELKQPIVANALNQIMALEVYQDDLYAFQGNEGIIHKFNGDIWSAIYNIGTTVVAESFGHAVYKNKLVFVGSLGGTGVIWVYDGSTVTPLTIAGVGVFRSCKEFRDILYVLGDTATDSVVYKTTNLLTFTLVTSRPHAETTRFQPGMAVFHDNLYWGGTAPPLGTTPVYQMTPAEVVSIVHNLAGVASTYGVKEYSWWLLIGCGGGQGIRLRNAAGALTDPGLVTPSSFGTDGLACYNGRQYANEATALYMGRPTGIGAGVPWTCVYRGHATPSMTIYRGKLVRAGGVDLSASDEGAAFASMFDEPPTKPVPDVWQWWDATAIAAATTTRAVPCWGQHEKTIAVLSDQNGTLDIEADFDGRGVYYKIASGLVVTGSATTPRIDLVEYDCAAIRIVFTPAALATVSAWIIAAPNGDH